MGIERGDFALRSGDEMENRNNGILESIKTIVGSGILTTLDSFVERYGLEKVIEVVGIIDQKRLGSKSLDAMGVLLEFSRLLESNETGVQPRCVGRLVLKSYNEREDSDGLGLYGICEKIELNEAGVQPRSVGKLVLTSYNKGAGHFDELGLSDFCEMLEPSNNNEELESSACLGLKALCKLSDLLQDGGSIMSMGATTGNVKIPSFSQYLAGIGESIVGKQ